MRKLSINLILVIISGLAGAYIAHYTKSDMVYYICVYITVFWLLGTIKGIFSILDKSKTSYIGPNVICTVGMWLVASQSIDLLFFSPMEVELNDILFTFVATMHGIYEYYNLKELTLKQNKYEFRK